MSEAAAFFASKKKKKKAFKFNANLVDAETVTQTIHVYVCLSAVFELGMAAAEFVVRVGMMLRLQLFLLLR